LTLEVAAINGKLSSSTRRNLLSTSNSGLKSLNEESSRNFACYTPQVKRHSKLLSIKIQNSFRVSNDDAIIYNYVKLCLAKCVNCDETCNQIFDELRLKSRPLVLDQNFCIFQSGIIENGNPDDEDKTCKKIDGRSKKNHDSRSD